MSRGIGVSFLRLPGIHDCPLCTDGEVDHPLLKCLLACMGLLLVLTNLFVLSPDGGKKREVQIYSVSVMEDQTDFIHK